MSELKKIEPPSGLPIGNSYRTFSQAPKSGTSKHKGSGKNKITTDAGDVAYSDSSEKYG